MFRVILEDGQENTYEYDEIDVSAVNREKVSQFYITEQDWHIGLDVKSGLLNFNGLVVPFAFHSETTEFILFKRMRFELTPESGEQSEPRVHSICFGLRNTIDTQDGSRNFVQLIWVNSDGSVTVGGNK